MTCARGSFSPLKVARWTPHFFHFISAAAPSVIHPISQQQSEGECDKNRRVEKQRVVTGGACKCRISQCRIRDSLSHCPPETCCVLSVAKHWVAQKGVQGGWKRSPRYQIKELLLHSSGGVGNSADEPPEKHLRQKNVTRIKITARPPRAHRNSRRLSAAYSFSRPSTPAGSPFNQPFFSQCARVPNCEMSFVR